MVERSEVIVFGEVRSGGASAGSDAVRPPNYCRSRCEDVLKGYGAWRDDHRPSARRASFAGGIAMKVLGLPMLAEGDRVLLFLDPLANDVYRPVELALGMFLRGPLRADERS